MQNQMMRLPSQIRVFGETMTFDVAEHISTFFFAVYTKNTGSTKTRSDLELLKLVHKKPAGFLHTMNRQSFVMWKRTLMVSQYKRWKMLRKTFNLPQENTMRNWQSGPI